MSTRDFPSPHVTQGAIIARAAQLATYYRGELDRQSLAWDELETLAEVDFSAMSTGHEIVNDMIVGGYAKALEAYSSLLPLDMAGMTFGAAPKSAENALNRLWTKLLSEHMTNELPFAEQRTFVNDLNTALWGYAAQLDEFYAKCQRRSRWRAFIRRICPQSLTVGINLPFVQSGGTWHIWRDR